MLWELLGCAIVIYTKWCTDCFYIDNAICIFNCTEGSGISHFPCVSYKIVMIFQCSLGSIYFCFAEQYFPGSLHIYCIYCIDSSYLANSFIIDLCRNPYHKRLLQKQFCTFILNAIQKSPLQNIPANLLVTLSPTLELAQGKWSHLTHDQHSFLLCIMSKATWRTKQAFTTVQSPVAGGWDCCHICSNIGTVLLEQLG